MSGDKYFTNTTLRFRRAGGIQQEIAEGEIVSFEEGDQVDIGFLLSVGAIVGIIEYVDEIAESPKGGAHG